MHKKSRLASLLLWTCFAGYALLMIWELFLGNYRTTGGFRSANFVPFHTIIRFIRYWQYNSLEIILINLAGNVIMFIPLGFFLCALIPKLRKAGIIFMLGTVLVILVEVLQYVLYVGILDVDDLILNTAGIMMGYAGFERVTRQYAKKRK